MTISQWRRFLQRWSDKWLARDEKFPRQVRERRWLGSQPATDKQISQLEKRLGYRLPPSYRNFLLTTNGWLRTSFCIARIRPVSEVDWLESDTPELLDGSSPEEGGDFDVWLNGDLVHSLRDSQTEPSAAKTSQLAWQRLGAS